MNVQRNYLAQAATQLADRLPFHVLTSFAEAIAKEGGRDWPASRSSILHHMPTPEFRDAGTTFLDRWKRDSSQVTPEAAAAALIAVAQAKQAHRAEESIELVWTGPETSGMRFRHTEQAILEVLNSATRRLTVVSYAVYRIPRIQDALIAAANRGVQITLIIETPNRVEGQGEYDCLLALGENIGLTAAVYFWPQENRARGDNGKPGILHVKCAVADGARLFLSSANLTDYAFTINMELGLLVTGGNLPGMVEMQFSRMIERAILVQV